MVRIQKVSPVSKKLAQYRKALIKTLYRMDDATMLLQELETNNRCLKERVVYLERKLDDYIELEGQHSHLKRRTESLEEQLEEYEEAFEELSKDFEVQKTELREMREDRHHFMTLCNNMVGIPLNDFTRTVHEVTDRRMDEIRSVVFNER